MRPDMLPSSLTDEDDEPGFPHKTVAVLSAFSVAVVRLSRAIEYATDAVLSMDDEEAAHWGDRAYEAAKAAARMARMLDIKPEYR